MRDVKILFFSYFTQGISVMTSRIIDVQMHEEFFSFFRVARGAKVHFREHPLSGMEK